MTAGADTVDAFFRGVFSLVQPAKGHRSGLDALLLASIVPAVARGRLLDLGAGSGAVAFAALTRCPGLDAVLLECQEAPCNRARQSLALPPNRHLDGRAEIVHGDVENAGRIHTEWRDGFDFVLANPPFNDASHRVSPDAAKALAHAGGADLLASWWKAALRVTRPGGTAAFILRASEWRGLAPSAGWGDVTLFPIHPRASEPASRIIVRARKGSRAASSIAPGLVLHEADGSFTPPARAIFDGQAGLLDALPS